jgi:Zn ribbon nucleic-acid-binding protein
MADDILPCTKCGVEKPTSEFYRQHRRTYKKRNGYYHECIVCRAMTEKLRLQILREKVFEKLGHACIKCGFANKLALQIDHVNGKGREERQAIKSQVKFLKKVLSDETGLYQILCANCNWIKRLTQETL